MNAKHPYLNRAGVGRRYVLPLFLFAACVAPLAGCGSRAGDIRRAAIQRAPDDEEETPAPPAAKVAVKPAAAAPANVAAATPAVAPTTPPKPNAPDLKTATAPPPSPVPVASTPSNTDQSPTPGVAKSVSGTQSPPAEPLDANARAHKTVDNLKRIGQAFEAFVKDKGFFPGRAIVDTSKAPLLSWRVALLPYMGYQDLYSKFRLDEPWNSRHNQELIKQIPAVYQSPERFDERTNYLVPVGPDTIFGLERPAWVAIIEDGPRNTVFVVEADDNLAVPWTEPRDYDLNIATPAKHLGSLRGDSFFVVWGNGEVGRVMKNSLLAHLKAMYTYEGGEDFVSGKIDKPLFPQIAAAPANVANSGAASSNGPAANKNAAPPRGAVAASSSADSAHASLSSTYLEHAAAAASSERDAGLWFYAAAVVGPPGGSWTEQYNWVLALRRPTPPVRFGVGLQYSGPRFNEVRDSSASANTGGKPQAWSLVTAKVGEELVKVLSAHLNRDNADSVHGKRPVVPIVQRRASPLDASPGGPLAPRVYYLATAREGVLREAAEREGVDVLVFVDWREVNKNYTANIELIDVVRNQTLVELPRIDSQQLEKTKTDPLADNPLRIALQKLSDFLEEQLQPEPLPARIEPRHVTSRLATLASSKPENPLRALAEMRYYRERGLADDTQLLLGYQALLGQQPGSELFLGDAAARSRVLKTWLPRPPDRATAQRQPITSNDD